VYARTPLSRPLCCAIVDAGAVQGDQASREQAEEQGVGDAADSGSTGGFRDGELAAAWQCTAPAPRLQQVPLVRRIPPCCCHSGALTLCMPFCLAVFTAQDGPGRLLWGQRMRCHVMRLHGGLGLAWPCAGGRLMLVVLSCWDRVDRAGGWCPSDVGGEQHH
jgi:hypothetical protein